MSKNILRNLKWLKKPVVSCITQYQFIDGKKDEGERLRIKYPLCPILKIISNVKSFCSFVLMQKPDVLTTFGRLDYN